MNARNRGGAVRSPGARARSARNAEARAAEVREAAVEEASRPQASARAETLFVWDTTAPPGATRIHEVITHKDRQGRIATKSYPLCNEKGMQMPAAHALQFLRDDAFIVSTTGEMDSREDNRVRPVKARTENVNIIALSENETIAEWSELSDDALIRRAHAFPSDAKPGVDASRAQLIVFLTEASRIKKADGDRLAEDEELEGMGAEELTRLFGGDRQKGINHNPMATGKKPS